MTHSPIPLPPTTSFWDASHTLREILATKLPVEEMAWAEPKLRSMGQTAAETVAPLAAIADRESPRLVTHSPYGERIDRVDYHPAYREMKIIAYGSGMVGMKYDPVVVAKHRSSVQLVGFALGYLFSMAEMGLYCPVCMTDGVARVLTKYGTADQIARVVPHLASSDLASLWTGAMFLTERVGGSDVGANETVARRGSDGRWRLTGQKWFCSNVDAEAVLVTARPEGAPAGTKGLRFYLLLPRGNPGVVIDRLKDKLGVRSMPTGEVTLTGAVAEEVGDFSAVTEMLNLSRLYNAVATVAVTGRAIHEARSYIEQRVAFGKRVIEHPLADETLRDLEAEHRAATMLVFETVDALGRADCGDAAAGALLRLLTPMVKAITGKLAVPLVSEAMELIGGNAYIEESPLPRMLRDAQVLPIWEGTTNILVLDAVRAARKGEALGLVLERIANHFPAEARELERDFRTLEERSARGFIERLARLFELTLLAEYGDHATLGRLGKRPMGLLPGAGTTLLASDAPTRFASSR